MSKTGLVVIGSVQTEAMRVARAVRGLGVYCEIAPAYTSAELLRKKQPMGLLFVGEEALLQEDSLLSLSVPVLCMGACSRALIRLCKGSIGSVAISDKLKTVPFLPHTLFKDTDGGPRQIRSACYLDLPEKWKVLSGVDGVPMAFCDSEDRLFGVQFSMESNDYDCLRMLANFALQICGCPKIWSMDRYARETVAFLREKVQDRPVALLLSGGVDSAVCAALAKRAVGSQLHCYYIHTGLSRSLHSEENLLSIEKALSLSIHRIEAQSRIFEKLHGVRDAEKKREVVEKTIARVFEEEIASLNQPLVIGSEIYEDEAVISPQDAALHPVHILFKNEVRELCSLLGLPEEVGKSPSFPTSGLALRCLGEVTPQRIACLRTADEILSEEIHKAQLDRHLTQYCAILFLVWVEQDHDYHNCILLYATQSRTRENEPKVYRMPYEVLEKVTQRIYAQLPGVSRVMYDLTGNLQSGLEWE